MVHKPPLLSPSKKLPAYLSLRLTPLFFLKKMFLKSFRLVVFASIFLLIFDRLYIHNLIVSTFRIEIDSNMTMILVPNHMLNNKNFITFPEFSWIIFLTILPSSILFSILNLPERLF